MSTSLRQIGQISSHYNSGTARSYQIIMYISIAGTLYNCMSVEVEQTSYGISDTITATIPLSTQTIDLGAQSQQLTENDGTVPLSVYMAFIDAKSGTPEPHLVINGLLDEIENDYTTDVITIKGRGLLAALVDARISVKPNMNSTITNAITSLIQRYSKLTPQVQSTSVLAGTVIKDDYISMSRNLRAMDFINILARSQGWYVRVSGGTIVVGDPVDPSSSQQFNLSWQNGDFLTLKINHNALHNKNIKVKVVSYQQGSKSRGVAKKQGAIAALLGLPVPTGKTGSSTGTKGGTISGSTSVGERDTVEEYVIPRPGLSQQDCDSLAQKLANDINRHEFVAQCTFTLSMADLRALVAVSPEFTVNISGCDQSSNNGKYFPKHVNWAWDVSDSSGITFDLELVNHILPVPTGGQANSTTGSVQTSSGT